MLTTTGWVNKYYGKEMQGEGSSSTLEVRECMTYGIVKTDSIEIPTGTQQDQTLLNTKNIKDNSKHLVNILKDNSGNADKRGYNDLKDTPDN